MDSLKVVGDVPECPGMGGVAIAHDLNRGFTANGTDDTVTVFALDTLKQVAKWKATGKRPNQIIFEPFTKRLFTFNSTGRNATVFDTTTGEVLATLPLDGRTEFAAFDRKGMVYDSLQDKATIVAIDARNVGAARAVGFAYARTLCQQAVRVCQLSCSPTSAFARPDARASVTGECRRR